MADIPATLWTPSDGNGEATFPGVQTLVDETGLILVDELGLSLVDTGNGIKPLAKTIWSQSDGN